MTMTITITITALHRDRLLLFAPTECNTGRAGPEHWYDQEDETCDDFEKGHWCTSSGGEGSGWKGSWGKLTDYLGGRLVGSSFTSPRSALDACCACGGGSREVQEQIS